MKKILSIFLISTVSAVSYSQQNILSKDLNQAKNLIEAYFSPLAESYGTGLNSGWYNTAKPHKLFGFDLTFNLNTVMIPNSAENFEIGSNFNDVFTSSENEAATIFGSSSSTNITYSPSIGGGSVDFEMPGGLKTPALPVPVLQGGIGLIKKTSLDFRYMPMLNIGDDINVNLYGFGLKHDLLQWIPAIGNAIPMSLSIQAGYSALDTELEFANHEVSLKTRATTINLVASKKILMLTGYAGVGYNSTKTNFKSSTSFDIDNISFSESLDIDFESNNDFRANIGLRINLAVITMHADYTFSKYPTATLGLGVSLR